MYLHLVNKYLHIKNNEIFEEQLFYVSTLRIYSQRLFVPLKLKER